MSIQPTSFAGSWYPATAEACEREIQQFQADKHMPLSPRGYNIGGIVPHAGWFYSGTIACRVIDALSLAAKPDTIVVFGRHMHPASTPVLMSAGGYQTPFGPLMVDEDFAGELEQHFDFEKETSQRFEPDNTIEVQLPFIKYFFPETALVAVGVPPTDIALSIGQAAAEIGRRQDKNLLVIGSTDMTHYGPNYGFSPQGHGPKAVKWVREKNDGPLIAAMEALDADQVLAQARTRHNACCSGAVAAALSAGRELGAGRGERVLYSTSYEKSPGSSFVGYAGILF
jgi:AmmeMemoRadiSam system protein B